MFHLYPNHIAVILDCWARKNVFDVGLLSSFTFMSQTVPYSVGSTLLKICILKEEQENKRMHRKTTTTITQKLILPICSENAKHFPIAKILLLVFEKEMHQSEYKKKIMVTSISFTIYRRKLCLTGYNL